MLTTITLGGPLGARFGRHWRLDLDAPSPAEAVRALQACCQGFREYMLRNSEPGYHVFIGKRDVGAAELEHPSGARGITIMPALGGAKDGWFQVILGAVLIAAGTAAFFLIPGAQPIAGVGIKLGLGLALGGIAQLISGAPEDPGPKEKDPANQPNYLFNGPVNTVAMGHPVPILYGELEIGSQVISAGLDSSWTVGVGFGGATGSGQTGVGGASPTGGACPAPWVPILLADGREVPAEALKVGMLVRTQHEIHGTWGDYPVEAVSLAEGMRWRIQLDDGRRFVATLNHRILTTEGWKEIHNIQLGEVPVGLPGKPWSPVVQRGPAPHGPVVKITIADARTYVSAGFLSHNVKKNDP